jgi:hypothetical protein
MYSTMYILPDLSLFTKWIKELGILLDTSIDTIWKHCIFFFSPTSSENYVHNMLINSNTE